MENTKDRVLNRTLNELRRADDAILTFLSLESLPEPIECKPGCHYCCFNLPVVTPPEALLIGNYLDRTFTQGQKASLRRINRKITEKIAGKPIDEIFMMRHELPCIFLKETMCLIYPARPAACRTCCSTSAAHCKMIFQTKNHRARLRSYHQLREVFETVHRRFIDFCREKGCQSDPLKLTDAVEDYFRHPDPIDAWSNGEIVFRYSYS